MPIIHFTECPRDAMQGWSHFIPTKSKIAYIQSLLNVGFDTIDCGSFVSAKAIPQMADTAEVLKHINVAGSLSKLLVIVANERGAKEAVQHDNVSYLGFPFSVSPTFQQRNVNQSTDESLKIVDTIQDLCTRHKKELVIYLSMAFGNPYGDMYGEDVLLRWASVMNDKGIKIISLADTVGLASPSQIRSALSVLIPAYHDVQFGVHLHSTRINFEDKLQAALTAGCTRFEGALAGIGGCPMAQDVLVGNMHTEKMIKYFQMLNAQMHIDNNALEECMKLTYETFDF